MLLSINITLVIYHQGLPLSLSLSPLSRSLSVCNCISKLGASIKHNILIIKGHTHIMKGTVLAINRYLLTNKGHTTVLEGDLCIGAFIVSSTMMKHYCSNVVGSINIS